jgi:putative tryptophan/tyrosine transport system substrate-binding protein
MQKRLFSIILTIILTGSFLKPVMAKTYKIGVTQIISHPAIDAARKGFYDQMTAEGFSKGKNVVYDFLNAEGDMTLVASIPKKFVTDKKDLIYSISTVSTQGAVAAAKGTKIPIVFSALTDPVAAKVVDSWDKPGGTCTGASDWVEISPQLKLFKEILPGIKRLGTIYNAGEANSVVQIKELKKAAAGYGITKIIEATAATTADVYAAANSLIGRVDAIWVPTDSTVVSSLGSVLKICEANKIPLFAAEGSIVEKGAICAVGFSYYELGKMAGKIAVRVLKGENPGDIPVAKAPLTDLFINLSAAKRMGVDIPQSVLNRATKTIK